MEKNKIALQLVGSPTSRFFFDLSMLYAKEVICPDGFDLLFAVAFPNGRWAVCQDLKKVSDSVSLPEMVNLTSGADIVVPHLFCPSGLIGLRIFFEDVLKIPVVGSSGNVLNISQNKHLTRLIAKELRINVPQGRLLSPNSDVNGLIESLQFPLVIKPNTGDNSEGLSLITNPDEIAEAVALARDHDVDILVEEYIAGRELRGALTEIDGEYRVLPFIEYGVSHGQPIRKKADKLKFDKKGALIAQSDKEEIPAYCPARLDEGLQSKLSEMMIAMHQGLHCRDFSMFDFRIHSPSGNPYLLEAGLYWSFSNTSMISAMLRHMQGADLKETTGKIWMQALRRKFTGN